MEYFAKSLCADTWETADPAQHEEFVSYNIRRTQQNGPDAYTFAAQDENGKSCVFTLSGAVNGNPLKGVANCELLVKDNVIGGINIEGECVVKKKDIITSS